MGADIKSLRIRIKSVDSTLHLTKAMGLVASSKIRRANEAMMKGREYGAAVKQAVSILSAGVPVGTVAKNRLEPHHAMFASCDLAACRRAVDLSLDDPRVDAFLHGEEIAVSCDKGLAAVGIEGVPCGFGKVSGDTVKNRYPKGLRKL